jgi:hypothetical protein
VLCDDIQQGVLFTGHQRRQRTHRTPHLLALAWPVPAARRPSGGQSHRGVELVEDGLCQLSQFGS